MSDTFDSTVRVLFTGDPAGLVEAYNAAADAATSTVDRIKAQASEASGSLDSTGASVEGLGVKFDQAGVAAEGMGAKLDAATAQTSGVADGMSAQMDRASASVTGLDEKLASVGDAATSAAGKVAGASDEMAASLDRAGVAAEGADAKIATVGKTSTESMGGASSALAGFGKSAALGLGGATVASVDLAAKFQTSMTQLVTGAGESEKNLATVSAGIESLAGKTATSTSELSAGMYMIESAGFHGAAGLKVLQTAAEGAKVGNAQLADVANVLTSALNAYHLPASDAVSVTNQLVATVASGKMHMQDLATAVSAVLPIAAASHIAFSQIGGALATMTMQGMSARRASMNLANVIRALIAPTSLAAQGMQAMGLNSTEIAQNLGKVGLTGTLDELTEAVLRNSKGGLVLAANFNGMGDAAKRMAIQILAGKLSAKDMAKEMQDLSSKQAGLVKSFDKTATSATGVKETYAAAMKQMIGGATGLNVALLLSGTHAQTFAANVKSISDAAQKGGDQVSGFALVQKDFSFQLESMKYSLEAVAIKIGTALIPILEKLFSAVGKVFGFIDSHKPVLIALATVIGGVVVTAIGTWTAGLVASALAAAAAIAPTTAFGAAAGGAAIGIDSMAAPITAIVAAIAILALAAYEVYKHWNVIWPEIKKITLAAWNAVKVAFDDVWHFIQHWGPVVAEAILVPLTAGMSLILPMIIRHWSEIESFFTSIPGRIESVLAGAINWLAKVGHDIVQGLWNGIKFVWKLVLDYFVTWPFDLLQIGVNAINWLYGVGESIVNGLLNGLKAAWHAVTGWVSTAVGVVKNIVTLGGLIGSDSPWFTEVGKAMMNGLANGIANNAPKAHAALKQVTHDLTTAGGAGLGTFNVAATAGTAGALAGGSSGPGGSVELNINVNGTRFATAIMPDMLTALQQHKRVVRDLDL